MPALPLAYVLACGSTQGPGRGQLVHSHIQTRTCQPQTSLANHRRPVGNPNQSSTFVLLFALFNCIFCSRDSIEGRCFRSVPVRSHLLGWYILMFRLHRPGMHPPTDLLIPGATSVPPEPHSLSPLKPRRSITAPALLP